MCSEKPQIIHLQSSSRIVTDTGVKCTIKSLSLFHLTGRVDFPGVCAVIFQNFPLGIGKGGSWLEGGNAGENDTRVWKHCVQDRQNIIFFTSKNAGSGGDCWRSMRCQNYPHVPPREFLLLTRELFTAQEPFLSTICLRLLTYSQIILLFLWETFCNVTFCFLKFLHQWYVAFQAYAHTHTHTHTHGHVHIVFICFLNKQENEVILTLWSENCFFHFTVFHECLCQNI